MKAALWLQLVDVDVSANRVKALYSHYGWNRTRHILNSSQVRQRMNRREKCNFFLFIRCRRESVGDWRTKAGIWYRRAGVPGTGTMCYVGHPRLLGQWLLSHVSLNFKELSMTRPVSRHNLCSYRYSLKTGLHFQSFCCIEDILFLDSRDSCELN